MNILVITQRWYPDSFGGSEHVASEQARWLVRLGHTVTVLTHNESNHSLDEEILVDQEKNGSNNPGKLRIVRYGASKQFKRWGMSLVDIFSVPNMVRKLSRSESFDVVVLHHPFPAFGFFLSKVKIPALYVFHASTAKEAEVEGMTRKFSGWKKFITPLLTLFFIIFTRHVEKTVLRKASRIVLFSEFSQSLLQETYPQPVNKVFRIGIGINSKLFVPVNNKSAIRKKLGLIESAPIVLTVRRLTERMGLLELLSAVVMVKQVIPDVVFLVVGDGPLKQILKQKADQLQLAENIWLIGKVPLNGLPAYYQAADLFVLPTIAYEGLGMSTLEALASGLPVVGTPVGATPEILSQLSDELIFHSSEAKDIAQGIIKFFQSSESVQISLGKKARQLITEKYDWHSSVVELEHHLQKIYTPSPY